MIKHASKRVELTIFATLQNPPWEIPFESHTLSGRDSYQDRFFINTFCRQKMLISTYATQLCLTPSHLGERVASALLSVDFFRRVKQQ